ncbi:MAG: competence/damage-inducible protein A [Phycisphaeraceae bacterium]|nr:competence/damage-inducible protein A [Phycisphaeraceae bacterium]MBX3367102.1 competence/damage-inducible protein A [Phycisphaeraceae bacterium]
MAVKSESVAIVSIGDELAIGQSLDTNSKWLSGKLTERGLTVVEHVTVPDDLERLVATLRRLTQTCSKIVVTGGLGPTEDDLTREAVGLLLGERLVEDSESLEAIRAWFAAAKRTMPERNRVQALRPESGVHLSNPNGTAPGLRVLFEGTTIWCLPGPPGEMRPMFERVVETEIQPPEGRKIRTVVFQTIGVGESDVAGRLGSLMSRGRNPLVGTTASAGIVSVRVRYEGGDTEDEVARLLDQTSAAVRDAVGDLVFAEGGGSLAEIALEKLRRVGGRLATVESCTGGMLGQSLTAVAGSSDVYVGGWVTYSNEMKSRLVGVDRGVIERHGAVSREVACEMAIGGLSRSDADHCLAITGVAGPGGGTAEKPVGTVWIGLASREGGVDCRRFQMRGERDSVRQWSVSSALVMLVLRLDGRSGVRLLRQAEA